MRLAIMLLAVVDIQFAPMLPASPPCDLSSGTLQKDICRTGQASIGIASNFKATQSGRMGPVDFRAGDALGFRQADVVSTSPDRAMDPNLDDSIALAEDLRARGNFGEAIAVLRALIPPANPYPKDLARVQLALSLIYTEIGDRDAAAEAFEWAVTDMGMRLFASSQSLFAEQIDLNVATDLAKILSHRGDDARAVPFAFAARQTALRQLLFPSWNTPSSNLDRDWSAEARRTRRAFTGFVSTAFRAEQTWLRTGRYPVYKSLLLRARKPDGI